MNSLMTIRAGICENLDTQGAPHQSIVEFIKSEPILAENVVDTFKTEEKSAKEIIRFLADHHLLLFSYGVESMPNQGHIGVMHITGKKLYLDGTEIDLEIAVKFVYSSKLNHAVVFKK